MERSWETATFPGLIAVLENPKWPVSKACQAVEDCLAANRDNLRGFFEQCFPALLKRLFGYDGASWLTLVAKSPKESDAKALLRLLSPRGALFVAMYSADADGSIRFVFPRERLPTHTQVLLAEPAGRRTLDQWPQYAGALVADAAGRVHIHLGVYQYFLFWFAFYAIKGGDGGDVGLRPAAAGLGSSVRKAADALHLTRGGRESEAMRHPYQAALRQLLMEMLPRPANAAQMAAAASPGKAGGSPYFRGGGTGRRQADSATRGLAFYATLLEFWVADGDEPVPLSSTGAAAERGPAAPEPSSLGPRWSTTYEPPSEDLLAALEELVKYATAVDAGPKGPQPAQGAVSWLPLAPMHTLLPPQVASRVSPAVAGPSRLGAAAQPPAQALARRLFRFFFRAFTMWPDRRSIKPILRVFLAYLAPWSSAAAAPATATGAFIAAPGHSALASHLTTHMSDLVQRVSDGGRAGGGSSRYGREWEAHVLSNLPFYTVLLPLFLEMGAARLQIRGETAAHDILRAFGVLEEAPELREMVARVERDAARFAASQPRRAEGPYAELLPWLAEQGCDWELAATVNITGDTPLLRQATPVSMLFSTSEGGAAFLARELLDMSANVLKPEPQARLRECLEAVLPLAALPTHPAQAAARVQEAAAYDDVVPRLPRSSWRDVRYKGDPLRRPVATYEVALLVRLLVALSQRANAWLRLDQAWTPEEDAPENRVQEGLAWLRRRGLRVNLRPLADARNLAWLPPAALAGYWALRVAAAALAATLSWLLSLLAAAPGSTAPR